MEAMKKCIIPLLLCLLLLAGCEQHPEPKGNRAEFDAFVAEVDAARAANANWTQEEKELFETYTPDISDQANVVTQEELEGLFTPKEVERVSREEALEDIDLFFRLLKSAYGGYDIHGGDEAFFAAKDEVLSHFTKDKDYTVATLKKHLENALSPFVRDGHFTIGEEPVLKDEQYMYYVPNLYFADATGLDMDYVKPTIGPDGALTYCFAALSTQRSSLPEQIGTYRDLDWVKAEPVRNVKRVAYRRTAESGVTILQCRIMEPTAQWRGQLEQLANSGADYRGLPTFLVDIRGNSGGGETSGSRWVEGFTGQTPVTKQGGAWKFSAAVEAWQSSEEFEQAGGDTIRSLLPQGDAGTWKASQTDGKRADSDSVVFVLTDRNTGSAGEGFLYSLRTVNQVVTVGSNTAGATIFGNRMTYYLPHSGVEMGFGPSFGFRETANNIEGIGILPDLWVNPADAQDAVLRLIDYYGLR